MAKEFVAFGICVILPIVVVWLSLRSRNKRIELRSQILMEAIRRGDNIDTERLINDFEKSKKPYLPHERQQRRLLRGVACTFAGLGLGAYSFFVEYNIDELVIMSIALLAVGIGFMTVYFTGRKYADKHKSSEE